MKELIEELERWGADVIFGRAKGLRAALMRFAMRALSGVFRIIVQLRLWSYRSGARPQQAESETSRDRASSLWSTGRGRARIRPKPDTMALFRRKPSSFTRVGQARAKAFDSTAGCPSAPAG